VAPLSDFARLISFASVIAAVVMAGLWAWQRHSRRSGLADGAWPLVTAGLAVFYANAGADAATRSAAIAWMIGSWGARLGVYLLWDDVFARAPDERRREPLRHFEGRAAAAVFFSLPALCAAIDPEPMLSIVELSAAGLWLVGFAGESTADRQLVRWRRARAAATLESTDAAQPEWPVGVWRYVPRAHDVFELVTWSAHALFAAASPFGWLAAACPVAVAYRLVTAGTRRARF
jgi:steroid 5-alpha reductase family enzyme